MKPVTFFTSHLFKGIVYGLAALLLALIIFQAGIFVGYRQAEFSSHWRDSYTMSFNDPRSAFAPFMRDQDDATPHGVVGEIASVSLPEIMVKGTGTAEEVVLVSTTTSIRNFRQDGVASDLKAGEQVIVIGTPNDSGQIEASFIRIVPPPPALAPGFSASSTTK